MDASANSPSPEDPADIFVVSERLRLTGRNDPCPCGSGRKYKKCCLAADEVRVREAARAAAVRPRHEVEPAAVSAPVDREEFDDDIEIEAEDAGSWAVDDEDSDDSQSDGAADEAELAPEVEQALDEIWAEFDLLEVPTTEQLDRLLTRLLTLPPEASDWNDLFQLCADNNHTDLPGVFRRIAAEVPMTADVDLSFFFWEVIERFISAGRIDLLPEVVAQLCAPGRDYCDADAQYHIGLWLQAAGCEAEALAVEDRFVEAVAYEGEGPGYALGECREHFELRVGACLREVRQSPVDPVTLAAKLLKGFEQVIHPDFARRAALVIAGASPTPVPRRADFDLPVMDVIEGTAGWEEALKQFEFLLHVAREAWQVEQRPPGIAIRGLRRLMDAVDGERREQERGPRRNKARGKIFGNLLDCLQPTGLETRVVRNSRGILGTNRPAAHLLLEAHATLLGFAQRHALIDAMLAEKTEKQLLDLKRTLAFPN